MTIFLFTLILLIGAFAAGLIGSLTGLGGGVVIIPMLTLAFNVDIRYAIGASLISVIATSSGAAASYVKEGISNMRIGMFLEIATTAGAIIGAITAVYAPTQLIAVIFGVILIISAGLSLQKRQEKIVNAPKNKIAGILRFNNSYPDIAGKDIHYTVTHIPGGFLMMIVAGMISGLLGIGSGALKVIAMDNIMHLPFKVSTTTSNFMIGVTAAASAGVYFSRGYIDPGLAFPVVLGVLAGASVGSGVLIKAQTKKLRVVFAVVITFLAIQMIYNGISGNL